MASTKLTLSIKPDLIDKAKRYASKHHTSLSKLFSELINEKMAKENPHDDPLLKAIAEMEVPESLKSLTGILKGKYPDDMDYKDMKYEYLKDRYDL